MLLKVNQEGISDIILNLLPSLKAQKQALQAREIVRCIAHRTYLGFQQTSQPCHHLSAKYQLCLKGLVTQVKFYLIIPIQSQINRLDWLPHPPETKLTRYISLGCCTGKVLRPILQWAIIIQQQTTEYNMEQTPSFLLKPLKPAKSLINH